MVRQSKQQILLVEAQGVIPEMVAAPAEGPQDLLYNHMNMLQAALVAVVGAAHLVPTKAAPVEA